MDMFSLKNKVAIVIGGARGIGEGIATGLSEAGATVVISSTSEAECQEVAEKIHQRTGNEAVGCYVDITIESTVTALVEKVAALYGHIDILVNSAGINVRKDTIDFTEADWDCVQDVQLKGTFFTCKAVGRHMIENNISGKIVNISSIDHKVVSRTNTISYMAAKGAVAQLTRTLAVEWAEKGICVNGIAPGYFETVMTKVLFQDKETREGLFRNIPQKKFGDPYQDLAALAIYLSSEYSNYTTGQIICVDGGYTLI